MGTDKNLGGPTEELLFPLFLDHAQHGFGVGGLFEGLTEFGFVQNLGNVGKSMEVLLKLTLGNEEKHDEIYGLIVEGIKVDPFL